MKYIRVALAAAIVVIAAVVAVLGVTFLSERSPIRADDSEPTATATSTQATTTGEIPFDLSAIPTIVPPPCVEEVRRKYAPHPDISFGYTATQCNLRDSDGNYISEAEAFLLIAEWERKKAQAAQNAAASVDPWLSVRSITLADGRVIHLPADVRIVDFVHSLEFQCLFQRSTFCPVIPFYKLVRGDKVVWIDAEGYVINFDGDESEPGGFQIPGIVDIRR